MSIRFHANGFTLLELMVALVVVSILLTIGLPSFSASVRQNCTITAANSMLTVLTAARSEALKRDRTVTLCKTSNGTTCATASGVGWESGYLMFLDADADNQFDGASAEQLLKVERPLTSCATITNSKQYVRYTGLGKMLDNSTFAVRATGTTPYARDVVISPAGRPRIVKP